MLNKGNCRKKKSQISMIWKYNLIIQWEWFVLSSNLEIIPFLNKKILHMYIYVYHILSSHWPLEVWLNDKLSQEMFSFHAKMKVLWNMWPTGVIDNLIPTVSLPGCISGIFPGLKVFVSLNLTGKCRYTTFINLYSQQILKKHLTQRSKSTLKNGIIME